MQFLTPALLLALASQGSGQFLRSWSGGISFSSSVSHSGPSSTWSSSFTKSSSWSQGPHGNMHNDVQETHSDVVSDSQGTQLLAFKTLCKDGDCQHTGVKAVKSVQPAVPRMRAPWAAGSSIGAQGLMKEILGSHVHVVKVAPQPAHVVTIIPMMPMRPSFRGSRPIIIDDAQAPRPPPMAPDRQVDSIGPMALIADGGMMAMMAAYMGLLAVMMSTLFLLMRLCSGSSAREVQIRTLAQPFAPAEETPRVQTVEESLRQSVPRQKVVAPSPTQTYLSNLYSRVEEKAEKRSIRQYMCTIYKRATA